MELNDLLNQFGADEKVQLTAYFTQVKDDGQAFTQDCAARMVQYSAELVNGQIDKQGYSDRMQGLQDEWRVKADAQVISTKLKWQALATQAVDLVAKIVISKIMG